MAKGLYTPINKNKYLGDVTKIRFMSSWELRFMDFCDKNPNIIEWGSEEIKIKYYHPIKKKMCNYLPDFIIKYKDVDGNIHTEIIEIKPFSQSSTKGKKTTYDKVQLIINEAKWKAANAFCLACKIKFKVLTENELFR